ncbi:MAG: internal scaffolding protein [Microvirus sp.]|nr:MAG: internal scaffolding protein [Microvirus sp.]
MKQPPELRTEHNYDRDAISEITGLDCPEDEGRTQQQFAEETDINTIVRRFGLTGQLPENVNMPSSGDFTTVHDFQSAMNLIRQSEQEFMKLPAEMRKRFEHDPQQLINFLEDGNNRPEAEKLGLINKPPEKTRDAVQAIDEMKAALTEPKK